MWPSRPSRPSEARGARSGAGSQPAQPVSGKDKTGAAQRLLDQIIRGGEHAETLYRLRKKVAMKTLIASFHAAGRRHESDVLASKVKCREVPWRTAGAWVGRGALRSAGEPG